MWRMNETRAKTTSAHFRIPVDVHAAAKARADTEHRSLSDAAVRLLRAYGDGDPAALAIVAGVSPAVLELHLTRTTGKRKGNDSA